MGRMMPTTCARCLNVNDWGDFGPCSGGECDDYDTCCGNVPCKCPPFIEWAIERIEQLESRISFLESEAGYAYD